MPFFTKIEDCETPYFELVGAGGGGGPRNQKEKTDHTNACALEIVVAAAAAMTRHVAKLACLLVMMLVLFAESVQGAPSSFRIAIVVDSPPLALSGVTSSILNDTITGAW
jgi:hypothetical protein